MVGIGLVDDRRGRFQFLDDHRAFFGGDPGRGADSFHARHHLLVVLHVQLILRLGRGQHLVQVASAGQISVLHGGMRQQLGDFVDVRALARLVEQLQQRVQRARIVPHMGDHGMQAGQQFGRVASPADDRHAGYKRREPRDTDRAGSQPSASRNSPSGSLCTVSSFSAIGAAFVRSPICKISLQQIAQALGMRIEVGGFLQVLDRVLRIVRFRARPVPRSSRT